MLDAPRRVLGGRTDDVLSYRDREVLAEEGLHARMLNKISSVRGDRFVGHVERRASFFIFSVNIRRGTPFQKEPGDTYLSNYVHLTFLLNGNTTCFVKRRSSVERIREMNVGALVQQKQRQINGAVVIIHMIPTRYDECRLVIQ